MTDFLPLAEPFLFKGGSVGALLIHGFTGTPKEVRPLGEALAADGLTVMGIRLAQHATFPEDMLHAEWRDWYHSALDGYFMLRAQCDQVFVMGLSMGGLLALNLAARYPVTGVVTMSTPAQPFYVKMDWRAHNAILFARVLKYAPKGKNYGVPRTPLLAEHPSYPEWPTLAIAQFNILLQDTLSRLNAITAPVLLAHSHTDDTILAENMLYLHTHLPNAHSTETLWLQQSGHLILEDVERDVVFERVKDFVKRVLAAGPQA